MISNRELTHNLIVELDVQIRHNDNKIRTLLEDVTAHERCLRIGELMVSNHELLKYRKTINRTYENLQGDK